MQIVIIGDGKVGYTLAHDLSLEGHDIVVIDSNQKVLRAAQEALDVAVIGGNGASVAIQREADVQHSDILIAATSRDEVNLLCCMTARKLGCKHTIARVRNPEYDQNLRLLREELGLSLSINPERATAKEIFRRLKYPTFLRRDSFAKGRVELVELKLKPGNPLIDKKLTELISLGFSRLNALICTVERDGNVTIPYGEFQLMESDIITIVADTAELAELIKILKITPHDTQSVMIIGGGRITEYLAPMLLKARVHVTIVEKNRARCEELCELLEGEIIVICGDGTEQGLLLSEGVGQTGALVALTDMDEENLIISMFGEYIGVPKNITKINRTEYAPIFANKGVEAIISPKQLTANEIVCYVRALGNTSGDSMVALTRIMDGAAEAVEFFIDEETGFLGIPLHELKLKANILIAAIIRARRVIIPKGDDHIEVGDTVVAVVPAESAVSDIKDIFKEGAYRLK